MFLQVNDDLYRFLEKEAISRGMSVKRLIIMVLRGKVNLPAFPTQQQ